MSIEANKTDCPSIMSLFPTPSHEVRMPTDEDEDLLDFYIPQKIEWDRWGDLGDPNIKKLISPYQEYAFSESVLHDVANQRLGFFIPYELWSDFNEAFAYYWDEEVGLNGVISEDFMFNSIRQQFIENGVLFPEELLSEAVSAIYDFLMEIPGVILDY